ncbi:MULTISPECIES: hypothetical protein [Okeania]|uniref:Tse2 family ADP-ribosyltransferase toxin n=1 Tax=Okeania TaxID=1458928 RepID=UPI0019621C8B|nr:MULTISPECIES: hypothetical protein [Okeania]
MDNVRSKDIATYVIDKEIWVNSSFEGGISTFAVPRGGKNWWKLERDTEIPSALTLINDYNNHWLWTPSYTMPLEKYKAVLREIGTYFKKIT